MKKLFNDIFYRKQTKIIFFGKSSFWNEKQFFQNFYFKSFHCSCKSENIWLCFKCNENSFLNIKIYSKTDIPAFRQLGSRRSLETRGTIHPRDTKPLFCSVAIEGHFGDISLPLKHGLCYWAPTLLFPWEIFPAGECLSSAYNQRTKCRTGFTEGSFLQ